MKTGALLKVSPSEGLTSMSVSQSAHATIIRYYRLSGFNNRKVFLTVLEAGSPRSQWQQGWVLSENPLPGLQVASTLLYPHVIERERTSPLVSSFQGTNSHHKGSTLMTSSKSTYLPKVQPPYTTSLGVRVLTYTFCGGHKHSDHKSQP